MYERKKKKEKRKTDSRWTHVGLRYSRAVCRESQIKIEKKRENCLVVGDRLCTDGDGTGKGKRKGRESRKGPTTLQGGQMISATYVAWPRREGKGKESREEMD